MVKAKRALALAELTADQREHWEERAAIREYDGGASRDVAELKALVDVRAREWLSDDAVK